MARVLAIEWVALDDAQLVYNFTVKGPHTYFVLDAGVLVHNDSGCKWAPKVQVWRDVETGRFISDVDAMGVPREWDGKKNAWVYPPNLTKPTRMPDGTIYKKGDVVAKKHLTDGRSEKIIDQLPGEEIDIIEASKRSGTPVEYLENISSEAQQTGVICGLRNCHVAMEKRRFDTLPKDTNAVVYDKDNPGVRLKVSSATDPRFKTHPDTGMVQLIYKKYDKKLKQDIDDPYALIGGPNASIITPEGAKDVATFKLVPMDQVVDNKGNIIWDPNNGLPMGPDVDTNYHLWQVGPRGAINLGSGTPMELNMRARLAEATSDYRTGIIEPIPAVGHGPGQPYFGNVLTWDDTLNVMPDGRFIWTQEKEIEPFFQYFGLSTRDRLVLSEK